MKSVWVFHGEGARFGSAIFALVETAEAWISENKCSGMLTEYPLNVSVFDWAVESGFFALEKIENKPMSFVQNFTSASQQHFHYINGDKQ